jgi:hypothetical protein
MGVGQSARFDRDGGVILQRRARSGGSGSSGAGKTCEGIGRRRARVGDASCGVHAEAAPRCSWRMRLESDVSGRLGRHRSGLRAGELCSSAAATHALAPGRDDGADRVCVRAIIDFHGGWWHATPSALARMSRCCGNASTTTPTPTSCNSLHVSSRPRPHLARLEQQPASGSRCRYGHGFKHPLPRRVALSELHQPAPAPPVARRRRPLAGREGERGAGCGCMSGPRPANPGPSGYELLRPGQR